MRCKLRANGLNLREPVGQFCWIVTGNLENNSLIHQETDLAAPQYHTRFEIHDLSTPPYGQCLPPPSLP
eukprot:COSAG02_NODE_396_length_23126_cov_282.150258_29_plen_69_part_00